MKICIIGIIESEQEYPRHRIIIEGLKQAGVEVHVIPLNCWIPVTQVLKYPAYAFLLAWCQFLLLMGYIHKIRKCDAIFVPAFKHLLIPYIWLLAKIFDKPLVVDYLIGLFDTNQDRKFHTSLFVTKIFYYWDKVILTNLQTITDTSQHRDHFISQLRLSSHHISIIPVGIREELLHLSDASDRQGCIIQYFGEYIPFHNVEVIIHAANLLRLHKDIFIELIGDGQQYDKCYNLAREFDLENIKFIKGYFPIDPYMNIIKDSIIHLGVFSNSNKTNYVIPNKVYEGLASGRLVITAQSESVQTYFEHEHDIILVPPDDPHALASLILKYCHDNSSRERIALAGRENVAMNFSPQRIGEYIKEIFENLMESYEQQK